MDDYLLVTFHTKLKGMNHMKLTNYIKQTHIRNFLRADQGWWSG